VVLLFGLALYSGVVNGQEKENGPKPASSAKQSVPAGKPNAPKTEAGKPAGPKEGVSLTGHLSRDSARPDGKIRFWVTIENNTDAVIRNLRFADFFTPGFDRPPQFSGGCAGASWGQICAELPSKATVTVWGDLAASEEGSTKENAFAVVVWDSPTRPKQSSVVQLGEIERLSWYEATWRWLTQLDVGLPTLTAMAIGIYGFMKRRREKAETERKEQRDREEAATRDARDRKEHLDAEQREQHQQTWNLMLPQANRFSLRYYIPTATAIVTATVHLKACRESVAAPGGVAEDELLSALFDLVQLQWHRLQMKRKIGGYYFKSRTAESVVEGLFQKHRSHFEVVSSHRFIVLIRFVKPFTRDYDVADFTAGRASRRVSTTLRHMLTEFSEYFM
jgi:hypothetical protein